MKAMIGIGAMLLLSVALTSGSATTIDHLNIEEVASIMCRESNTLHSKKSIGNLATIGKLLAYFKLQDLPSENGATKCRDLYLESIERLASVVDTSSWDVCSKEKVDAIYKFHWDYIIRSLSKRWQKASSADKKLPEMLRIFFMNYANEVANRCKDTLKDRLEEAASAATVDVGSLLSTKFGESIDSISIALVSRKRVTNYDSFILIWNYIVAKDRKKGDFYEEVRDPITGEISYGDAKMKDAKDVWQVQRKCRHDLRPVYQNTVLPLMRLIEMGYGTLDESSGKLVKSTKSIGDWYAIAQVCELMIPINMYQDESLKEGESIIVKSEKDLAGLVQTDDSVPVDKLKKSVQVQPIKQEVTLSSAGDDKIMKQVKANLKARNKTFKIVFRNVLSTIKTQLKMKWRNLSFWRKGEDNKVCKKSGEEILEETHDVDQVLKEEDEEESPATSTSLTRNKRASRSSKSAMNRTRKMTRGEKIWVLIIIFVIICALGACHAMHGR